MAADTPQRSDNSHAPLMDQNSATPVNSEERITKRREETAMTWLEIGLFWIVFSVGIPILLGLRFTRLKEYRERLVKARTRFHRFHVAHSVPPMAR